MLMSRVLHALDEEVCAITRKSIFVRRKRSSASSDGQTMDSFSLKGIWYTRQLAERLDHLAVKRITLTLHGLQAPPNHQKYASTRG
jgi:hypothetical protein